MKTTDGQRAAFREGWRKARAGVPVGLEEMGGTEVLELLDDIDEALTQLAAEREKSAGLAEDLAALHSGDDEMLEQMTRAESDRDTALAAQKAAEAKYAACAHAIGVEYEADGHGPQPGPVEDVVRYIKEAVNAREDALPGGTRSVVYWNRLYLEAEAKLDESYAAQKAAEERAEAHYKFLIEMWHAFAGDPLSHAIIDSHLAKNPSLNIVADAIERKDYRK